MVILYFTAYCSLLAEYIESHTKTAEKTTTTDIGKFSKVWFGISVK
jgi:hypothetical protein